MKILLAGDAGCLSATELMAHNYWKENDLSGNAPEDYEVDQQKESN